MNKVLNQHCIDIDVKFGNYNRQMSAYQLSPNLCLLRRCVFRGTVPFVRFPDKFSLTHIPSGLRICVIEGEKDELMKMAEELEAISDLSRPDTSALTTKQKEANEIAVSPYITWP